jgi:hypothetical protein
MVHRNVRRAAAIATFAAAALAVAPAAAQAHTQPAKVQLPGIVSLTPGHGLLTDNPIANYKTTKACAADHRALGAVVLESPDGTPNFLSDNFTPTAAKPSGSLAGTSLLSVVRAADLTTGWYEVDVLCYNADFTDAAKADVNVIHIDVEDGTWCSPVSFSAADVRHYTKAN